MNDTQTRPRPDTRDMHAVHQVFRDSLGCAPQLVGSVAPDDFDRIAAVATFYANVLAFLHAHHEGEDELIWPLLLARAPEQTAMIQRVAGQHGTVLESLTTAETRLADWAADPNIERGASLAAALAVLGAELGKHLDDEERNILPLAAEHVTVDEWAQLPAHGMRTFRGDKQWLVLGLIQEQMPPAAREQMDAKMPPPVRDYWVGTGRQQFAEFVAALRG
jgi:hemerythrin-like domain-containing protein